jgi:hypothetical protein
MKHWMNFGVAGLMVMSLPALAVAQTTPTQTTPPTNTPQTMPQQRQQQGMPTQRSTPGRASSEKVQKEVSIAHTHALMAQGAQTVQKAHEHLQHVINCLEGPTGTDFNSQMENPCKGAGQGALPDSQGNSSRQQQLRQAVSQAKQGLQTDDLSSAQTDASKVASLLQAQSSRGISSGGIH